MRINKYVAGATGLSRRAADQAIAEGRVRVNNQLPQTGQDIANDDIVAFDGKVLQGTKPVQTILFNKPAGYIVSRDGQGEQTIYDLLPAKLHHLKPVGRLDKFSSGLLLLTNDGLLAEQLTHPRYHKAKIYEVKLSKQLTPNDWQVITDKRVQLDDGPSGFQLEPLTGQNYSWKIIMHGGRNRQIRRTFLALGYGVTRLHRISFGPYQLGSVPSGAYQAVV